ncbi:MAG: DUF4263 domain-containing protein [Candidatus Margulisbacteria bacterium]|nr:DUF4263 domain-containing protein [Candidatus Margulisiibacteriota bacterium]
MSIQYDRIIFSNDKLTLKINFSGIKDSVVRANDLKMSVYAFKNDTAEPVFSEELEINQIRSLYNQLNAISIIKDSSISSSGSFIEIEKHIHSKLELFSALDRSTLQKLVSKLDAAEEIGIDNIVAAQRIVKWRIQLDNLKLLLELEENGNIVDEINKRQSLQEYIASQPEKIFQNWIEKNLWIFGVEYSKKHDARKIAIFSEADLLMESLDGFMDLIELKRPKYKIFQLDNSHKCYYPSSDLAKVIGQCLFYMQKLDEYKLILEKEHNVKIIRPRIKIIAGRTTNFDKTQFEALRMLNCNLNHIQIISYDYLLNCGEQILSNYK